MVGGRHLSEKNGPVSVTTHVLQNLLVCQRTENVQSSGRANHAMLQCSLCLQELLLCSQYNTNEDELQKKKKDQSFL